MSAQPTFPVARQRCPFSAPPQYDDWRAEGKPVKVTFPNGTQAWAITAYDQVKQVLNDHEHTTANKLAQGFPQLREGVIAFTNKGNLEYLDEPQHSELRKMMAPFFTARRIKEREGQLQAIVDQVVDEMLKLPGEADLHQVFSLPIPSLVICDLLGVPYSDHEFFEEVTATMLSRETTKEAFQQTFAELLAFLEDVIDRKIADPPADDLLGQMVIEGYRTGIHDRETLVNMSLQLLVGGHETTANSISMGVLSVLTDADLRARLTQDPGGWESAVDEFLRLHSITDMVTIRLCTADFEVGGQLIKKGEGVLPLLAAANHDPQAFPEPTAVREDRPRAVRHLTFGQGIHTCIAQTLARAEMLFAYRTLFDRVPTLRLTVPESEVDYKFDGFVWGVRSLPVAW